MLAVHKRIMKGRRKFDTGGDVDALVEGAHKVLDWFSGSAMPPKVKNFLKEHGEEKITSLKVGRTPISKVLDLVVDVISAGEYAKVKKKLGYDKMYHLYVIVNDKFILEKNELFNVKSYSSSKDEEVINISLNKDLTIGEFMRKASEGDEENFFRNYSAFGANCQMMVIRLLSKNGLLTDAARTFVKQDVETILKETGETSKKAEHITNIGSILNRLLQIASGGRLGFAVGNEDLGNSGKGLISPKIKRRSKSFTHI
jgi:hypothetical protein